MIKKIVLGVAIAAAGATSLYCGGVFYTGVKLNEFLENSDKLIAQKHQVQNLVPGASLTYEPKSKGFFSENGTFIFDARGEKSEIDVEFEKSFLKTKANFDTQKLKDLIKEIPGLNFDNESVNVNANLVVSALSADADFNCDLDAKYKNVKDKNYSSKFNVNIDKDENINTSFAITNFISDTASIDSLNFTSKMQGLSEIKEPGEIALSIKGISANSYVSKSVDFKAKSINLQKNGDFDLNITAKGDSILDYLFDYNIDLTVSKFNKNILSEYQKAKGQNADLAKQVISSVNAMKIDKLDGRLSQIVGFFTGISNIDKMNITSTGGFIWDSKLGPNSIKGSLTLKSDVQDSAHKFFMPKDGKFVSVISVQNNQFYVNGQRFM